MAKQIPLPKQYPIPENWKWVEMKDLTFMRSGFPFDSGKFSTDAEGRKPLIRIRDVVRGETSTYTDEDCPNEYIIHFGDVLIGMDGDFNIAKWKSGDALLNQRVCYICSTSNALLNDYLYYYLPDPLKKINDATPSVTVKHLSTKTLAKTSIPLPPLSEQRRIVDRIESLFAKLDEAKEKAQAVVDGFEDRKAAILHKAFTGALTEEWRNRNKPPIAFEYLEKIQNSDNCFSRKEFKFWSNDCLPKGWAESKIGNLLYFAGRIGWKGLKAEEYTDVGPFLLSVYNLNDGDEVTYHRVYHISDERYEESPEIMVQEGDVLLTKDGAGIGKLGYVKDLPQKATINSSLLLIRPANAAVSKYIYYILLGPNLQRIVKERITGSATPHLFQRDIKEFVIPVPSLEEQEQIVVLLDNMLSKLQQAKESAEQVIDQIDTIKKSILARAFRGELGTNDPADESAEELLKRIL